MKTLLQPEHYLSDAVWQAERQAIFFKQWQYAGHAAELKENQDWIMVTVGGREVMVQNFGGELRAFTNVCSHRFSAIRSAPCGHGPLQCPYHHWAYDKDGVPKGIPLRSQFPELAEPGAAQRLALEQWQVEKCGGLIFVRLAKTGDDLKSFLGAAWEPLCTATTPLTEVVCDFEQVIEANWKLVIQNTLEVYHIVAVHPRSFGKGMSYQKLDPLRLRDPIGAFPHLCYRVESEEVPAARSVALGVQAQARSLVKRATAGSAFKLQEMLSQRLRRKLGPETFTKQGSLLHFGVFPCLNIALNSAGLVVTEVLYTPLSPSRTRMRFRLWSRSLESLSVADRAFIRLRHLRQSRTARIIAGEDTFASEAVQRGLVNIGEKVTGGVYSESEQMAHLFQQHYLAAMKG